MTTQNKTPAGVAADSLITTRAADQNAGKILGGSAGGGAMPALTAKLFLPEDLEDVRRTKKLGESDLSALQAVADWIKTFVARPHKDLGRAGPVCPFVPQACKRKTVWLAPERIADRSVLEIVQLIRVYQKLFLEAQPVDGDDATYKSIIVVFTDLSADRAKDLFDDVLQHFGVPSYAEDGLVLGGFYATNEGSALYNPSFRPFTAPVPFLLMRPAVISDWKFFLDNEDRLNLWARRYGESAVPALAEELRRLPWRARRDQFEDTCQESSGKRQAATSPS
ncbi:hypothetical protein SAMN04488498_12220 [Mesorhizobium albiziae]|uniref:DUF6875 domain-containing protein n=1 Tax=Neomesorhizobium albiziae TaxID=335020 RepID=A0A1I4E2M7_9HYPH|nr:hypothetical protein [Mesorhizobium albiziae]GLS32520.1 hypothetical protein GCM10007937_42300 [Mesorhizobium albiziae]SFL00025.1 hypothetical protein SAMN04488498_12220 [Mesorhizobium albiziae]